MLILPSLILFVSIKLRLIKLLMRKGKFNYKDIMAIGISVNAQLDIQELLSFQNIYQYHWFKIYLKNIILNKAEY